jgi:hypothetical protein
MSASNNLARFLDELRETGTELPVRNSEVANLLHAALEDFDISRDSQFNRLPRKKREALELVQENLIADLEVLIESLQFVEVQDGDDDDDGLDADDEEE